MNIRLIDTSVLLNLLRVPARCQDAEKVLNEFRQAIDNSEQLILPLAAIIETGNHIAHIGDGSLRRSIAKQFADFIQSSLGSETPWFYDDCELSKEDLLYIVENFPRKAMEQVSLGDISIIRQYEKFKEKNGAIGRIMIWSTDIHLQIYCEDLTGVSRRRDM